MEFNCLSLLLGLDSPTNSHFEQQATCHLLNSLTREPLDGPETRWSEFPYSRVREFEVLDYELVINTPEPSLLSQPTSPEGITVFPAPFCSLPHPVDPGFPNVDPWWSTLGKRARQLMPTLSSSLPAVSVSVLPGLGWRSATGTSVGSAHASGGSASSKFDHPFDIDSVLTSLGLDYSALFGSRDFTGCWTKIGEALLIAGGNSDIYQARVDDGAKVNGVQIIAVKVLRSIRIPLSSAPDQVMTKVWTAYVEKEGG
ncbi:hypothetical protein FRC02_012303 [Tulasnella sp. 418]|nr:hypothetical protein FRC02_012303 [Tulasnella sp. 418]